MTSILNQCGLIFIFYKVFRDEDSRKYVGGVSENIVHFIRKGALDGAVFHFNMLNREHCPITQQRFAFQSVGSFSAENFDIADTARLEIILILQLPCMLHNTIHNVTIKVSF